MTLARPIVPGKSYLLTRRCAQREILLTPTLLLNQIFLFCLAWIANNCQIDLHAVCVLGNHYHLVVTDPLGRLPEFMQELNKYTAKCINTAKGRSENLWSAEQPSTVELLGTDDVLDKIIYTLANPVSSMLVPRGDMWPGLRMGPDAWGQNIVVKRPKVFFRDDGPVPRKVTLRMKRPPIQIEFTSNELAGLVLGEVEAREAELRRTARLEHRRYLGSMEVMREVKGRKPRRERQRRGLKPRVAGKDRWRRVEALQRIREWTVAYKEALLKWCAGNKDTVFPAGTYSLRVRAGVACCPFSSG